MECKRVKMGKFITVKGEMNWSYTDNSKMQWTGTGYFPSKDCTVYYSGCEKQKINGIAYIDRKAIIKTEL